MAMVIRPCCGAVNDYLTKIGYRVLLVIVKTTCINTIKPQVRIRGFVLMRHV